jgi:hypothetical protein
MQINNFANHYLGLLSENHYEDYSEKKEMIG